MQTQHNQKHPRTGTLIPTNIALNLYPGRDHYEKRNCDITKQKK